MQLSFDCYLFKNLTHIDVKFHLISEINRQYDFNNVEYHVNGVKKYSGGKIDFENKKLILSESLIIREWLTSKLEKLVYNGDYIPRTKTIHSIKISKQTMIQINDAKKFMENGK